MAPSRRRGGKAAAAAAAARRKWKVGELVLAKVKGFPAWPATVSEPEKWGYSSDGKKVLVYFFGTQQIAFCNPADVEAFTEEKKQSLLNKRHGKGADFVRALKEITECFEKLKKQEEFADCSANEVTAENGGNLVEQLQDRSNAPGVTLDSKFKSDPARNGGEPAPLSEDASAAEQMLALRDNSAEREQPTNSTSVKETTKLTTYSSRKRNGGSRSKQHALLRKESSTQPSKSLSKMEMSSVSSMSHCNDGGQIVGDVDDGVLRRKRIRRSSGASEIHDTNSSVLKSNGSDGDDASEVATVESDNVVINGGSGIDSNSKLEHADVVAECLEGDAELSKGLDFQIKAVLVKKKRKPSRKRGTNCVAERPLNGDVEAHLETGVQNTSQNSCDSGNLNERPSKENGDEHLPLVKRARVRMSRTCFTDEEANISLQADDKCPKELAVSAMGQASLFSANESDSHSNEGSFVAKETLAYSLKADGQVTSDAAEGVSSLELKSSDGVSSPKSRTRILENEAEIQKANIQVSTDTADGASSLGFKSSGVSPLKSHTQILENKIEIQELVDNQCNNSPVIETDPPPQQPVCDAVEALSLDSAEEIQLCCTASADTNAVITESRFHQMGCSDIDMVIKAEKRLELDKVDSFPDTALELKESTGSSAQEESQKRISWEEISVLPAACQKDKSPEQSHLNDMAPSTGSKGGAENVGLRESPKSPKNVQLGKVSKSPSELDTSKCSQVKQNLASFNEIDVAPPGGTSKANIGSADCEDTGLLKPQNTGNSHLNSMSEVMEEISKEQVDNANSVSFSDNPSCEKMSISSADSMDSPVRGTPHSNSVFHISTAESANIIQNNGCYSPNGHDKKVMGDVSFDGGKIPAAMPQGSKSISVASNCAEAQTALSLFEDMLGCLARTKESIGRATRLAIDCAKSGACTKAVETLARSLESEPSLHRRVDLFFLVDSIAQCSRGLKGDAGGAYISAIQALLPRLLSATAPQGDIAQENRRQCLKVLRLWLERRILPESVVRQHVRELEAQSSSISAGPYSRRSARTERPFDDPVRDMEGMLVDEYGSNSSLQLAGFCMPSVLKDEDENEGSDSDGENFEAVTPEHYSATPEDQNSTPAVERHTHILEDVDGELEMEDVAPSCEAGANAYSDVCKVNASQSLNNQFVPPPQDVPPSSAPLPSSPPPALAPPQPPPNGPCAMSSYPNGMDRHIHAGTHEDHLGGPLGAPRMNPVPPSSATHYQGPDCRYLHMPNQTSEPTYSSSCAHPPNHMPHMDGSNFQQPAYPPCPPQPPLPPPPNQFPYMHGPPNMKSRREGPSSYSQRSHYMPNYTDRNFHHNHERMRPAPYESRDGWRFPPPYYGPRYHDKPRSSYGSGSHGRHPREPQSFQNHRWAHPPRPSNHRNSFHFKPHSEDPVPVGMRASSMWHQR